MTWAFVLGCAGLTGGASILAAAENTPADTNNPYSIISIRNVFHLNDPPPPPAPPEPPPVNLPKVMLTAFVGKGSSTKVYLAIPPREAKEAVYFTPGMVPGRKDHDVELVRINFDEKKKEMPKSVDILNSGTAQTLTVLSNSYLAAGSPAPAAAGGKGGGPAGMPPGMGGGLRHQPAGAVQGNPPPRGAPPAAAAAPSSGESSAIIAGGGGGSTIIAGGSSVSPLAANNYSGGAYVSGGNSYVSGGNPTVATSAGNGVGSQLANSLFSPQTGRGQSAQGSAGPVAPLHAQAAGLIIYGAAGGPPSPINEDFEPGVGNEGGPPAPP